MVMHLVLAMFETKRIIDEPMDVPLWRQCSSYLQRILNVLETSKKVRRTQAVAGGHGLMLLIDALSMPWGCTSVLRGVIPFQEPNSDLDSSVLRRRCSKMWMTCRRPLWLPSPGARQRALRVMPLTAAARSDGFPI